LRDLPVDVIKIDRSFVATAAVEPRSHAIVEAITALARSLDLDVVAEGVESEAQAERLEAAGVTHLQGYHFGRAVGPEVAVRWFGLRLPIASPSPNS
jgi:sensor c-di-GMP phosphodiesterase-like protein